MVNAGSYAGDISTKEGWELLARDPQAQLVDVRSAAEWTFVGLPDLTTVGREVLLVEWQMFPGMAHNPNFVAETQARLAEVGGKANTPLLFLCRSGSRSRAAAIALTAAGFTQAYNLAGGFEGDPDRNRHRGRINGWKADGLPWRQT